MFVTVTVQDLIKLIGPWIVVFFAFWYFKWKKERDHTKMLVNLKKGDKVVTDSGILGTVVGFKRGGKVVQLKVGEHTFLDIEKQVILKLDDQDL